MYVSFLNMKNLRLAKDEISLLREKDFKIMLRQKKLYLVLDLDHTLLNSTRYNDITKGEGHLQGQRYTLPGMAPLVFGNIVLASKVCISFLFLFFPCTSTFKGDWLHVISYFDNSGTSLRKREKEKIQKNKNKCILSNSI